MPRRSRLAAIDSLTERRAWRARVGRELLPPPVSRQQLAEHLRQWTRTRRRWTCVEPALEVRSPTSDRTDKQESVHYAMRRTSE
jgi:hypothetical protein